MSFAGEGLACIRGERLVFSELSFRLEPGGTLLLTGPNGSGKSSLLRLCAGLLEPAAGRLRWNDGEMEQASLRYLGHLDAVKPVLTVEENIGFWVGLEGGDPSAALDAVGLADLAELPARFLSAGQRRRLALARLALAPSDLWLLDEPTVGLDSEGVDRLATLVAAHCHAGGMVMAASHVDLGFPATSRLALARR